MIQNQAFVISVWTVVFEMIQSFAVDSLQLMKSFFRFWREEFLSSLVFDSQQLNFYIEIFEGF